MYNWIDGRKFSNSKSLLTFNLSSKHLNPFIKSGFESNTFSQLPVIKEKEGFLTEDEVELTQEFLQSPLFGNSYVGQTSSYVTDSHRYLNSLEKKKNAKLVTKLPPLVNITCLMNTDIKQTPAIWNTNFGRHFINAKNTEEDFDSPSDIKRVSFNYTKSDKNKIRNYDFSKSTSKRKCAQEQNIRYDGGNKINVRPFETNIRKPKKIEKNNQIFLKKNPTQKKNTPETKSKLLLSEKFQETLSKKSLKEGETVSFFSKKQKVLTECVQSILDCYSTGMTCEYCHKKLSDIEEFNAHKTQHEAEKEICLLCNKIFYDSKKFTQHLLTHESVDQFGCKKCKKYFPNLKKYEQHCQNSHLTLPCNIISKSSNYSELVEEQLPKFECKQCKQCNLKFDSKKAYEGHKMFHTKKDLGSAYLLGFKNI